MGAGAGRHLWKADRQFILAGGPSADAFADALRQALQDRPSRFENRLEAAAGEFNIAAIAARFCNHLKEREL